MNIEESVISTLCYSSIFNWSLTFKEIYRYLYRFKTSEQELLECINYLVKKGIITQDRGFFSLTKYSNGIDNRVNAINENYFLLKKGIKFCKFLGKYVSGIKFIGISGSVSVGGIGDIDLFIIAEKLYKTRLISRVISKFINTLMGKHLFCLNFFMSENNLSIKDKNIYIAREIAQLIPVFSTDNMYIRFIESNEWIYDFLPNFSPYCVISSDESYIKKFTSFLNPLGESLSMKLQVELFKRKYGNIEGDVEISENILKLNLSRNRERILSSFYRRIKEYNIYE